MKIFLDTNVLLDVLADRKPFVAEALKIWSMAEQGSINGIVAAISLTNIYYIIRKHQHHRAAHKAMVLLRDTFAVAGCDGQVMNQAIDSRMVDFEDAVQYFSAVHAGADCIVTRNADHFPRSGCPIATPTEFIASIPNP